MNAMQAIIEAVEKGGILFSWGGKLVAGFMDEDRAYDFSFRYGDGNTEAIDAAFACDTLFIVYIS